MKMDYKELLQKINAGEFTLSSIATKKEFVEQEIEDGDELPVDVEVEKEDEMKKEVEDAIEALKELLKELLDVLKEEIMELDEEGEENEEGEGEDKENNSEDKEGNEESIVYPDQKPEQEPKQEPEEQEGCHKKKEESVEEDDLIEKIDWSKIKWGSLTKWLKQHYGSAAFNSDGSIKKSFVRDLLNNPNVSDKIKKKIRFYLNVLAKRK